MSVLLLVVPDQEPASGSLKHGLRTSQSRTNLGIVGTYCTVCTTVQDPFSGSTKSLQHLHLHLQAGPWIHPIHPILSWELVSSLNHTPLCTTAKETKHHRRSLITTLRRNNLTARPRPFLPWVDLSNLTRPSLIVPSFFPPHLLSIPVVYSTVLRTSSQKTGPSTVPISEGLQQRASTPGLASFLPLTLCPSLSLSLSQRCACLYSFLHYPLIPHLLPTFPSLHNSKQPSPIFLSFVLVSFCFISTLAQRSWDPQLSLLSLAVCSFPESKGFNIRYPVPSAHRPRPPHSLQRPPYNKTAT